MGSETIELPRMSAYEVAEAIAPTWERRRAQIEGFVAPVREWLLRELRAREGDTVLELAAGPGDTGFDAAAIVGASGRLISSGFSPAMLAAARRRGGERALRTSSIGSSTPGGSSLRPTRSTGCCAGLGTC